MKQTIAQRVKGLVQIFNNGEVEMPESIIIITSAIDSHEFPSGVIMKQNCMYEGTKDAMTQALVAAYAAVVKADKPKPKVSQRDQWLKHMEQLRRYRRR